MPNASYAQSSFLGGEVSKNMQGRFDTREYRTFLNVCFNGLPTETGSWTRRPGTRHLGSTRRDLNGRLIPFSFKAAQPIMMDLTDFHLRFWNGTQLVMTDDGLFVADISTANPAVVRTTTPHGWSTNNEVQFQLPGPLCPLLQNRQFLITVIDATHFSLQDDESGFSIDGATLGWVAPASPVQVTRVLDVGTTYAAADWQPIRSVQTETTAVLLNGKAPFRVDATPGNPFPTFTWNPVIFSDGPYLDPVPGSIMTPNAVSGTITFTCNTLVNNGAGFTAADVGRMVRFFSEPKPWPGAGTGVAGDIVSYGGGYWIQQVVATATAPGSIGVFAAPAQGVQNPPLPTFTSVGPPGLASAFAPAAGSASASSTVISTTTAAPQWLPLTVAAAAGWRWGTIASVLSTVQITVSNLSAPLVANTPVNTWRLGVYGGPNGWPTCGTYKYGRLWLSGAIDNRVDASNSNDLYNFAPTSADGTVLASSAIAAIFDAPDVNPIFWMKPVDKGIACGTQAGEWLLALAAGSNIPQVDRVTGNGCANIEPAPTENTLVVIQNFKRKLLEFFADVFSGKFSAPDLTKSWKHLTQPFIQEIAYQQELVPVVWSRLGDGTFAGMTYKRDSLMSSQGPSFAGGHRHTLGSGWQVKSIATGSNDAGTLDALTMVTYDPSTNIYHVEQLTDLFQEGSRKSKAWFLDSAVRPTSWQLTAVDGVLVFQLNGLWHLNNYTVMAYIGGLDCGNYKVTNGSINIPLQGDPNGLLTEDFINNSFATGGLDMLVGFDMVSQGQIVRPIAAQESGARNGPALGTVRRSHLASVLFQDTAGVSIGTDLAKLRPCLFKSAGGTVPLTPFQMFSGVFKATIDDNHSFDSMPCWQVSRGQPCTVVAIEAFLKTEDE
jgi:hypothetical protein